MQIRCENDYMNPSLAVVIDDFASHVPTDGYEIVLHFLQIIFMIFSYTDILVFFGIEYNNV